MTNKTTTLHNFFLLNLFFFIAFFPSSLVAHKRITSPAQAGKTLFLAYVAGDNNLDYFAKKNIEQMKRIGSNENISIVVQLDLYGSNEHTKRLYIGNGVAYQVNSNDATSQQKLNSGSAQTLIDFVQWAVDNYPADYIVLDLWNHGSGILDSIKNKAANPSELFIFNPANHMLELNRSIGLFDYLESKAFKHTNPEFFYTNRSDRGVCFSDTYGSYLTNQKLEYALKTICRDVLGGKKIDIITFDACLMSMIEVADLVAPYANYMVASQEVELGTGWDYSLALEPFMHTRLTPREFAEHMVESYRQAYQFVTKDFTQAAIDLSKVEKLKDNFNQICLVLLDALDYQLNSSVKRSIRASRSKRVCTYFAEPSYIDLHHFYANLSQTTEFMLVDPSKQALITQLSDLLEKGRFLILDAVIANEVGEFLKEAQGISIYFPLNYIDASYALTPFCKATNWLKLLNFVL